MNLELLTTIEALHPLRAEWNGLLTRSTANLVFLSWEWQTTWWESYQPGQLHVLLARDEDGTLIGIAPWFIESGTPTLRTIGCVDVTDYLDVLADSRHLEPFLTAVVDYLCTPAQTAQTGFTVSALDFCNIPQASPTLTHLPRLLTERGFSCQVRQQEVCPAIALPSDFEAYLNQLDKKQRHECRRKLRRAEENDDEKVAWYIVGAEHDLDAELDRFLRLMGASHPDKAEFLTDPTHVKFFRAMAHHMAALGWLQLSFLTVNGTAVAGYLNFDYNNHIQVYNSGLLPDQYAYLSTGIVLLLYNIQHAIAQGRTVFDFLRGNEEYKYRMGGVDQPVMNLEATFPAVSSVAGV